jgi:hypothetical protein
MIAFSFIQITLRINEDLLYSGYSQSFIDETSRRGDDLLQDHLSGIIFPIVDTVDVDSLRDKLLEFSEQSHTSTRIPERR